LQSGLSIVSTIDPNTEGQSDVMTQIYEMLAILVFLVARRPSDDAQRDCAQSFYDCLSADFALTARLAEWSVAQAGQVLGSRVQLAAPMMVTLLVSDIALGILRESHRP
jgi:flagellar biosynthesis protein FliR